MGAPWKLDKGAYRRRSVIECRIDWLKECRRIGTRFEKLAINFPAMIELAVIRRYLRVWDTSDRAYGNAESAGPGSAVPRPGIAFAWVVGVAVADRYVYIGDSIDRRMPRLRITHAAEKTCPVR